MLMTNHCVAGKTQNESPITEVKEPYSAAFSLPALPHPVFASPLSGRVS